MNSTEDIRIGARVMPTSEPAAVPGPSARGNVAGDEVDLRQIFYVFWRGKFTIFAFTLLFAVLAALYMLSLNLSYTARSVIMLDTRERQVTDLEGVLSGLQVDWNLINSEREVLRSRELLGRVADDLGLPQMMAQAARSAEAEKPGFSVRPGAVRDLLGYIPLIGDVFKAPVFTAPSLSDEQIMRERSIDLLLATMVVEPIPDSYVFNIDVTSGDPSRSAMIANAIAEAYVRNQLEVKFNATRDASEWLTARVAELKQGLEAAEGRVEEFNSSTSVVSEQALAATGRQLKDLRDRARRLNDEREANARQRTTLMLAAETGDFSGLRQPSVPPRLRALATELEAAEGAAAGAAAGGSETARDTLRAELESMIRDYLRRLAAKDEKIRKQLPIIERSVGEIESRMDAQSADLVVLRQLRREAEASRLIYEHFLSRMKETSVQQGIQQADSRILSRAIQPVAPSSPRKVRGVMLGAILGFVLGAGMVFLRDQFDNTFRRSDELEAQTRLPVLGTIPTAPRKQPGALLDYLLEIPASNFAESIRNLRTAVMMVRAGQGAQVIMTCSSLAGEGKTTVSLMLAQNFAALGRRVLLIEGDVRRRSFGRYFDSEEVAGALAVLEGRIALGEAVKHDDRTGIDVLLAEETRPNVADIFASQGFADLVATARETYDYVIIDTPPLLLVPDARIISEYSDAVLYVIRWNQTPRELVMQGLNLFRQVGVEVTGTVLSQVSARRMAGSGYAGDGSYNRAYGKYYKN